MPCEMKPHPGPYAIITQSTLVRIQSTSKVGLHESGFNPDPKNLCGSADLIGIIDPGSIRIAVLGWWKNVLVMTSPFINQ